VVVSLLEVGSANEGCHSGSKHLVVLGLATTGGSNQHETVTHRTSIVELDDLVNETVNRLKLVLVALLLEFDEQSTEINLWLSDSREQIRDNVLEQRQIVLQELGHVDITQRAQQDLSLSGIRVERVRKKQTSGINDGSDSTHSVVIMVLAGELL